MSDRTQEDELKQQLEQAQKQVAQLRPLVELLECKCDTASFGGYTCPRCQALASIPSPDFIHKQELVETVALLKKLVEHYFEPQIAHYRINAELKRLESLTKEPR